jgi:hypothetical protein
MALALSQRAKFEPWLKFELAAMAAANGACDVRLEPSCGRGKRADLSFVYDGNTFLVELKTANGNWRMKGVENRVRPITNNIESVVVDARKLRASGEPGLIAFVLFPIPSSDSQWRTYLKRISSQVSVELSEEKHCCRVEVQLQCGSTCEAVVCCFSLNDLPHH